MIRFQLQQMMQVNTHNVGLPIAKTEDKKYILKFYPYQIFCQGSFSELSN